MKGSDCVTCGKTICFQRVSFMCGCSPQEWAPYFFIFLCAHPKDCRHWLIASFMVRLLSILIPRYVKFCTSSMASARECSVLPGMVHTGKLSSLSFACLGDSLKAIVFVFSIFITARCRWAQFCRVLSIVCNSC